jgi:putative Mg2+ transporter-C (MgtC) family protein
VDSSPSPSPHADDKGGAIIRQGDITTGNATAASVRVVGIMGAAVGYGYYDIGIILAATNPAVLLIRTPF